MVKPGKGTVEEGGGGGGGWIRETCLRRDRQDCFRKVKISRALEPFLPTGGVVVVEFGEGEGEGGDVGEEGCGVEVPP